MGDDQQRDRAVAGKEEGKGRLRETEKGGTSGRKELVGNCSRKSGRKTSPQTKNSGNYRRNRLTQAGWYNIIIQCDQVCKCSGQSPGRTFYHKIFQKENMREDGNKPLLACGKFN